MSLYFESLKPTTEERTIKKWREHAAEMRKLLDGKDVDCRDIRNVSRQLRYETEVTKSWDLYFNNMKLQDRINETKILIRYAEAMLPQIAKEKDLVEAENTEAETLSQKCDTWISICLEGLNSLDKNQENELTRDDEGVEETKNEIKLLEELKKDLKINSLLAWEEMCRLENAQAKLSLNLDFKKEVLAIDIRCQNLEKMNTGVSYKVDPTKGPNPMLTMEEWQKTVYDLVESCKKEILQSVKLRERMLMTRTAFLNKYHVQFEKTDFAMRKRVYEINREKNEGQYRMLRVKEMLEATKAEITRLEFFLQELKDDLRCAETRCADRFFRPSVDATIDPPFTGMNKEVHDLRAKVEEIESHLDILRTFCEKLDTDGYNSFIETEAKNKSLQVQVQSLDVRIAGRYDPHKIYAYDPDILLSKMVTQMPPFFSLYSSRY